MRKMCDCEVVRAEVRTPAAMLMLRGMTVQSLGLRPPKSHSYYGRSRSQTARYARCDHSDCCLSAGANCATN